MINNWWFAYSPHTVGNTLFAKAIYPWITNGRFHPLSSFGWCIENRVCPPLSGLFAGSLRASPFSEWTLFYTLKFGVMTRPACGKADSASNCTWSSILLPNTFMYYPGFRAWHDSWQMHKHSHEGKYMGLLLAEQRKHLFFHKQRKHFFFTWGKGACRGEVTRSPTVGLC